MPTGQFRKEWRVRRGISQLSVGGGVARQSYLQKIIAMFGTSLIGYWPGSEEAGTVAVDYSGNGYNGVYTGVTFGQEGIGDGLICPRYDGTNDFNNLYSAGLASAFNVNAGTALVWIKIGATEWTDGSNRYALRLGADDNNHVIINKSTANNFVNTTYRANFTSETVTFSVAGRLDFFSLGLTWDTSADQMKCYYAGTQQGTTQTSLGVWAGALDSTRCLSGAFTTAGGNGFIGNIAHVLLLNRVATPAEVAMVAL